MKNPPLGAHMARVARESVGRPEIMCISRYCEICAADASGNGGNENEGKSVFECDEMPRAVRLFANSFLQRD